MVRKNKPAVWTMGLLLLAMMGLWADPALVAAQPKTDYQVIDTAKVTKVDYQIKSYKGKDRLHVTVELQNVSSQPKRFRVNIWLPDGVSGGGFYPRKTGVIGPDKSLSQTWPMYYDKMPPEATIVVKELPTD
jgi:hypothetical protein